jgi:hypothetical protein
MRTTIAPDVMGIPEALTLFDRLGYPHYLLAFLGIAKLIGALAVLAPVPPTVKEWAYAGLAFDLIGAVYSHLRIGDSVDQWWGALFGLVLLVPAYVLYRKRLASASFGVPVTTTT